MTFFAYHYIKLCLYFVCLYSEKDMEFQIAFSIQFWMTHNPASGWGGVRSGCACMSMFMYLYHHKCFLSLFWVCFLLRWAAGFATHHIMQTPVLTQTVLSVTKPKTSPHRLLTLLKGQRKKNIANCILILWSVTKHDSVRMNWDKFALPSKHLSVWSSFFSVVLRWCWYAFEWGCFQMWLKKSAMRQGINISNLRAISAEKDSWQLLRKSESIAACLHMQEITYAST